VPTDYFFTFDISNSLENTAKFEITLPIRNIAKIITGVNTGTCNAFTTIIQADGSELDSLLADPVITCTADEAKRTITIHGYCIGGSLCITSTNKTIKFYIDRNMIQNMGWIIPPAQYDHTKDPVIIKSTTADGLYYVDGSSPPTADTDPAYSTPLLIENRIDLPDYEIKR
jgi:hypothetical protein